MTDQLHPAAKPEHVRQVLDKTLSDALRETGRAIRMAKVSLVANDDRDSALLWIEDAKLSLFQAISMVNEPPDAEP